LPIVVVFPVQPLDRLLERSGQVACVPARLEPLDELCRRGHAHVRSDQRFLEALPRGVVGRVERRHRNLLGQRAPALAKGVAQAREEAAPVLGILVRPGLAEQLSPRPRHGRGR
jgi:hypothetical protein